MENELLEAEVVARRFDTTEREYGLTERKVALMWRSIFFGMTVILIAITVYCYLDSAHETIPLVTGPFGIATGIASYLEGRRAYAEPPDAS